MKITILIKSTDDLKKLRDIAFALEKISINPQVITGPNDLANLDLSLRTHNCLIANCTTTIPQLMALNTQALLRIPNFGRRSLDEVRRALTEHGIKPRDD